MDGHGTASLAHERHPYLWFNSDAKNEFWMRLDLNYYRPLHLAALKGDWQSASRFFENDPDAMTARITSHSRTALHVAAMEGHSEFVEKLVQLMPQEALAMQDFVNYTALHYVAMGGTEKAAKALVIKNPALTQLMNNVGVTPLHLAALCNYKNMEEVLRYLSLVTTDEPPGSPFSGPGAWNLISSVAQSGFYDITLGLVNRYPHLATACDDDGDCILRVLSRKSMDFPSGCRLGFWGRSIYPLVPVEVHYTSTVSATGMKKVHVTKLRHQYAIQLVQLINQQVSRMDNNWQVFEFFGKSAAMHIAAAYGIVEIVRECLITFPDLIWVNTNINMLRFAVVYRQEKIFSLVCDTVARNNLIALQWNDKENHILFEAAKLATHSQLSSVSGSALQMQRELQWFKAVEKLVGPSLKLSQNRNHKTPREVFTEEHKELVEEGEKWMKDTSNSCMLVAALIATVVFTAAFTVPGGNNSDKGIPIFLEKMSFMVFAISDALSLFSSSTSILMFLSILTARYAEEDFLESLPKRMIIALASLYVAMATMMIAFGAAFSIVLGDRIKWIAIPITLLASFPVAMFIMLQLPLFLQMVQSTYGRSFSPQRI